MRTAVLLLAVVLMPFGAAAQEAAAGSLAELNRRSVLDEGDRIRFVFAYRHATDEFELKGKVVNLTDSAIRVRVDSLPVGSTDLVFDTDRQGAWIEIPESRVQQIEVSRRGDSLWNGFLIGGAVGAGTMLLMVGGMAGEADEFAQIAAIGFAIGAPIGLATDAVSAGKRELVYLAPGPVAASGPGFSMSPIVTKKHKGLLFTLSW